MEQPIQNLAVTEPSEEIDFTKKKKKRPVKSVTVAEPARNDLPVELQQVLQQELLIPDYTYEFLLRRLYDQLPTSGTAARKLTLPVPQVGMVGTKRTCIVNFTIICSQIQRPDEHVKAYIAKELGAIVSQSGTNGQLIIKGRYKTTQIESIFRSYVSNYVTCSVCKNHHTELVKEDRLTFVKCLGCHTKQSLISKGV